ncbi:uncharacterized protein [Dysidea avara]|uniref:uncharacterized protein isoform X3 n=1 Tax=Dysidea avara TaxID=196820 RepID=UPI003332A370
MMDEVKFLYECVKAGKLSNAEAKEFLSSGGSSESRERGQQLKVAAGAATVPAVRNEADTAVGVLSKKAELMAKYKAIQKISMGGMKFNDLKQCGTRCKELGPMVAISLRPAATYEEIVGMAKQQFFAESNVSSDEDRYEYFLADPQGSKLMNSIAGKSWSLAQYIHVHGYYPSKTKIYCVQCDKGQNALEEYVMKKDSNAEKFTHIGSNKDSMNHSSADICDKRPLVIEVSEGAPGNLEVTKKNKDPFLLSGTQISLGRKLGEGGFGMVYLSHLNGTEVAVKQLKLDKRADGDHMDEVKALSALRHPNIVVFMGYTCDDNSIQIVTNYVRGGDLYKLLFTEKKQLTVSNRNFIAEQITQALTYMHTLSPPMIHRDIKPSNILVEESTLHVYLTDMGMAKVKFSCSTLTEACCVGTPYYAAPETFDGVVGKASDIWSLGIVLIELYGQQHAWRNVKTNNQLMMQLLTKKLPTYSHLDQHVQQVCESCLKYEPKQCSSGAEILQLIRTSN